MVTEGFFGIDDWIEEAINDAIDWAIENLFRKPLNGIMMVIETFKRIVCFSCIGKSARLARSVKSAIFRLRRHTR